MMSRRQPMLAAAAAALALSQAGAAAAADGRFEDHFGGGKAELTWRSYPMFGDGALEGRAVDAAPDGDGGIGVLRADGSAPGAVSYAETAKAEDSFALGAQVYCPLDAEERDGSLAGLALFVDPDRSADPETGGFYRLVCDYRFGDASFSFAYVGANLGRMPLELERWPLRAQPAPPDGHAGWNQLEVEVEQGLIEIFLNGAQLNERPLPAERVITDIVNVAAGYAGVYAGHLGEASPAEARIDAFVYDVR
jgi:hypothetical protein